jgi:hypothetical protein
MTGQNDTIVCLYCFGKGTQPPAMDIPRGGVLPEFPPDEPCQRCRGAGLLPKDYPYPW